MKLFRQRWSLPNQLQNLADEHMACVDPISEHMAYAQENPN